MPLKTSKLTGQPERFARKAPRREPSVQDRLQDEAIDAAAGEVLEQLKRTVSENRDRRIVTLSKPDLRHIAIGAISAWALVRARQALAHPDLGATLRETVPIVEDLVG